MTGRASASGCPVSRYNSEYLSVCGGGHEGVFQGPFFVNACSIGCQAPAWSGACDDETRMVAAAGALRAQIGVGAIMPGNKRSDMDRITSNILDMARFSGLTTEFTASHLFVVKSPAGSCSFSCYLRFKVIPTVLRNVADAGLYSDLVYKVTVGKYL